MSALPPINYEAGSAALDAHRPGWIRFYARHGAWWKCEELARAITDPALQEEMRRYARQARAYADRQTELTAAAGGAA